MSLPENDPEAIEPVVRTLQIIVASLVMGVVTFLVIVVGFVPRFIGPQGGPAGGIPPVGFGGMQLITMAALFMGLSALVMSYVLPGVLVTSGRRQIARERKIPEAGKKLSPTVQASDPGRLLSLFQNQLIVGAALAEGGAFFAVIAYMLERHPAALVMAAVLLAVLMSRFPTRDRVAAWLDRQLVLLQEERQAGF